MMNRLYLAFQRFVGSDSKCHLTTTPRRKSASKLRSNASKLLTASCFSSSIVTCCTVSLADWPEFRGKHQNGVVMAPSMPIEWNESNSVQWYSPTEGLGWSSPVIAGDRIYFTTAVQQPTGQGSSNATAQNAIESQDPLAGEQLLCLVCHSADTGKQIFKKVIFKQPASAPAIHKKNSHASPTPVLDGDRVYVHFGHQGTACTDLSGDILWTDTEHTYPPVHGNGGSPIIVENKLVLTCDGGSNPYTLALDKLTGIEVWRTPRNAGSNQEFSFCTPQLIEVNGQKQIVSPGSDVVQSLAPEDGSVIWQLKYKGYSVIPRPLYHEGLLFLSTGYTAPQILAVDPTGKGDVTETHLRWSSKTAAPNTPSFVPHESNIISISDSGIAAAFDAQTGKEIWKKRIGGNYSASPTIVGNIIYFQSEDGTTYVYNLDGAPKEIARNALPGRSFASYAAIDRDWIIRTEGGLYRISLN